MNIVKELRKKKGIQQKELAIEIGVSRPTVSEWESGKKDPSGERLKKLAQYFNVDELVILGKNVIDLNDKHREKEVVLVKEGNIYPKLTYADFADSGIGKKYTEDLIKSLSGKKNVLPKM